MYEFKSISNKLYWVGSDGNYHEVVTPTETSDCFVIDGKIYTVQPEQTGKVTVGLTYNLEDERAEDIVKRFEATHDLHHPIYFGSLREQILSGILDGSDEEESRLDNLEQRLNELDIHMNGRLEVVEKQSSYLYDVVLPHTLKMISATAFALSQFFSLRTIVRDVVNAKSDLSGVLSEMSRKALRLRDAMLEDR
jgi:hypothetical protein